MSSQVVRVETYNKGSLSAIGMEVERQGDDLMEHRNPDIDKDRTHLNEHFKATKHGLYQEWKDVCKKMNVVNSDSIKKNVTAFEGTVITADVEFFRKLGYVQGQPPPPAVREFFKKSWEFLKAEVGFEGTDENFLCAYVHYDEICPHLQAYHVPVVDSWKEKVYEKDSDGKVLKNENGSPIQARDSKGKIIYNTVTHSDERRINRTQFWQNKGGNTSYTQMQDRFHEQVGMEFGLGRGEKGSTAQHTTKSEWEAQQLNKQIVAKRKELDSLEKKSQTLAEQLEYAKDGSVLVPQLATKTKASEIQKQNEALRQEVVKLQRENAQLLEKQQRHDEVMEKYKHDTTDRNGLFRAGADALNYQQILHDWMSDGMDAGYKKSVLQPYFDRIDRIVALGKDMDEHKRGYVQAQEDRIALKDVIGDIQGKQTVLKRDLGDLQRQTDELNALRDVLDRLEYEKSNLPKLSPKNIGLSKQIKEQKGKVAEQEQLIVSDFGLNGKTSREDLAYEIRVMEAQLDTYKFQIKDYTEQSENLSRIAKEHLDEFKAIQIASRALKEPEKAILGRFDSEYDVPAKYDMDMYACRHVPDEFIKAPERKRATIALTALRDSVDKRLAEKVTKEPKVKTKTQERSYGD